MAIARKKKVNNKAGYVIKPVAVNDIVKQADFGSFKLTITKDCACYTNYLGYSVITKPYTTTPEGKATELSLYAWMAYAVDNKDYLEAHKDDIHPELGIKNGEWLESIKIITEANITKPCVVFTDANYAAEEASRHMDWLIKKTDELKNSMTTTPPEEDEKANAVAFGEAIDTENFLNVMQQEG